METASIKYYQFKGLLQQQGWLCPAYVGVNAAGEIKYLAAKPPQESIALEVVQGFVLPGFQNAHSHAFQYAMAGMAEKHPAGSDDDFWSWRETMYECALNIDPDQMEAVAAMLYTEMLRRGYTHVAEFHYLHHDKNGFPYQHLAEMGERLVAAAKSAGIKITLVPVFYQRGGFGKNFQPRQRRFISKTVDLYFNLLEDSRNVVKAQPHATLGFGVHSLRAVDAIDICKTFENGPKDLPFHIHAAEQLQEVDDCYEYLSMRPVEWLLENLPLHDRFHIVHATHLYDDELKRLAQSGANVVLCPGTEGNLGDGIFRLKEYAAHYGNWSIGTDSHISLNPVEDLRWLDYGQRLISHKRNTFDDGATVLINKTITAGRKAMGNYAANFFEIGKPFDAVVFDAASPTLAQSKQEHLLPAIVYTTDSATVMGTIVDGKWIVQNHRHLHDQIIKTAFSKVIKKIVH